jgi:hypothetical protein
MALRPMSCSSLVASSTARTASGSSRTRFGQRRAASLATPFDDGAAALWGVPGKTVAGRETHRPSRLADGRCNPCQWPHTEEFSRVDGLKLEDWEDGQEASWSSHRKLRSPGADLRSLTSGL